MTYRKTLLLKILMGVASIRLISDLVLITIMGATYTWFGVLTALFNCFILGIGLDVVRG